MVNVAPKQRMDVESYFAMDRVAEEKHTYWDGEVFAMSGGSQAHAALGAAVVGELRQRLRGGPCRPHNSEQRIGLPSGRYVYPDATVIGYRSIIPRRLPPRFSAFVARRALRPAR